MLKPKWIVIVCLALSICLAAVVRENSSSFQKCQSQYQADHAGQQEIKGLSFVFGRVFAPRCTASFISSHHAIITAISTLLIAAFTASLWLSNYNLWSLARDEFTATHRPRLRIRKIAFDGFTETEFMPAFITVTNIGENEATIVGLGGGFAQRVGGKWPGAMPDPTAAGVPPDPVLIPGQRRTYPFNTNVPIQPGHADGFRSGEHLLFIIGEVRYRDRLGIVRQTGFGWQYNHSSGEFHKPTRDDEYNYED